MIPSLNTRARLARAARNNAPLQTATETFQRFKWFTLGLIILFPLYPSISLIGSDVSAHGADYDESSIITAYSDDSQGDSWYFSSNWLIVVGKVQDTSSDLPILAEVEKGDMITTPKNADKKRAPQIVRYTIKAGDTLAKISNTYNVSIDAIRWANDVSLDTLKPGMIIKVPPTSGVVHIVKKWDTISGISARYNISSTDIASFNQLGDKMILRIGQELMIPWAQKNITIAKVTPPATQVKSLTPVPQTKPSTKPTVVDSTTGLKSSYAVVYTGKNRGFVAGNCTAYVAQNKTVTWRGNANAWIRNARAQWVPTGSKPIPGAIVQFSGRGYSRAYGHVGIVADVQGDYIIVKDMNYRGLYEVTIRKVKKDDPAIDGYIYVD